jgi:hypothetical protein
MKATQYERLERLLTRKKGATAMDIATEVGSTSPHKRLSELKERGWTIWREAVNGKSYGVYRGVKPQGA